MLTNDNATEGKTMDHEVQQKARAELAGMVQRAGVRDPGRVKAIVAAMIGEGHAKIDPADGFVSWPKARFDWDIEGGIRQWMQDPTNAWLAVERDEGEPAQAVKERLGKAIAAHFGLEPPKMTKREMGVALFHEVAGSGEYHEPAKPEPGSKADVGNRLLEVL